ncbi:MAG: hypothetical protein WD749_03085, partial [Phycisphaerales bacterium]
QPRFPQVWVFHAWNMAYNISVSTQTPMERWRWVSAGIHLLRDEGIPANPNDLLIHKELAWIFLHKIGGFMDDANRIYKRELAAEWTMILGPPPKPGPGDREFAAATARYAEWFRPVAEAPTDPRDVVAAEPSTKTLVDRLRAELGMEPGDALVQVYAQAHAIATSPSRPMFERGMGPEEKKLLEMVTDPALQKAWGALLPFLRKQMLIERYHMEPDRMLRYIEKFGPLDWRHCGAHALYWGQRGIENALLRVQERNKKDFDFVNSGRIVVQSLQDLWRSGDVHFDFISYIRARGDEHQKTSVYYRGAPHIHFIDSYGKHLDEYVNMAWAEWQKNEQGVAQRTRVFTLYAAGYENFRKDAIRFLYRRGEKARAQKMKDELQDWRYHNRNDPDRPYLFALTLDEFVKKELEDELSRPSVATEEVVGALEGAYITGLLAGDDVQFREQMEYARLVHQYYFSQQGRTNAVDVNNARMGYMDRDFRLVAGTEFAALIGRLALEDAEALYDRAPESLRVFGYDILAEYYRALLDQMAAERLSRPFNQVFPEPEGMATFRAEMRQREERLRRPEVEQK